jgi:hypothetical protein
VFPFISNNPHKGVLLCNNPSFKSIYIPFPKVIDPFNQVDLMTTLHLNPYSLLPKVLSTILTTLVWVVRNERFV